jgi:hypothetical protein
VILNGPLANKAVIRSASLGRLKPTQIGRSLYPTIMVGHGPQSRSQLSHTSFKHLRLI